MAAQYGYIFGYEKKTRECVNRVDFEFSHLVTTMKKMKKIIPHEKYIVNVLY